MYREAAAKGTIGYNNDQAVIIVYAGVVNGAEWLGGNSQQVTGDSGLI